MKGWKLRPKPMKPEIKTLWVAALKSGDFQQAECRLHKRVNGVHTYCCLGVLCELHRQAHPSPINQWEVDDTDDGLTYHGHANDLPYEVTVWAGLSGPDPIVSEGHLALVNDGVTLHGVATTFPEIADMIERDL